MPAAPRRIVVAVTGASGMPYAATLLRALARAEAVETHLILSDAAHAVMELEAGGADGTAPEGESPAAAPLTPAALAALAHAAYSQADIGAPPASGSWVHHGMVVCPCSMASLAAIANGLGTNLVHRAADVTLKESRPLVLVPRETPLSRVHLKNMLAAQEAGAVILPACPGFYHAPRTVQELVDQVVGRILDHLAVPHTLGPRWTGSAR
ncbi:MAG: UbiX family flavin prenyltransferase [Desulfovibrionaceae bacterium]|nr:UbiX family flavin prenyltransferase [Desulfovibrionaceae bacterium]